MISNSVTSSVITDNHIQNWTDLRVSTNPSFSLEMIDKVSSRHDPFISSSASSSSVMKNRPFSVFFEKPALEQSLDT